MALEPNQDVSFFGMVHSAIERQRSATPDDRRDSTRRPYDCVQLMAYFDGKNFPAQEAFDRVRCHDLSPHGFSFLTSSEPRDPFVIVALGDLPWSMFIAEIRNISQLDEQDRTEYRIGCQFINRITSRKE
jgi:hypothetical protein